MITSKDVAKLAGVSYATVCRVFRNEGNVSEQTRSRILAAAESLNYSPDRIASSMKKGQSNTVAFLDPDPRNPFYMRHISGISEYLRREYDYQTLMIPDTSYSERAPEAIRTLLSYRVDGIIFTPFSQYKKKMESLRKLIHSEKKCRFLQLHRNAFSEIDSVDYDDYLTMYRLTELLITHGEDRILLVTEDATRMNAFLKAHLDHGMTNSSPLLSNADSDLSADDCIAMIRKYRPGIVISIAQNASLNMLEAITRLGLRIPEDISFIVYDETPWAKALGITTMGHEEELAIRHAAERIHGLITGEYTVPEHFVVPNHINFRRSYPDPDLS